MESAQQDPRVGVVLNGRYRITELLGEGGMGLVYRGERVQLGRPVAIKFLHLNYSKSPKFVARFEREARAMSKLSHPYCVSVIDFGVHDEPYIVMDFVVGETLREIMDRERLSPQRAVQITRQILAGLAHAHDQGVIHRDIKPGNVMVGAATAVGDHVRIFDFGLAKLQDPGLEGDQSVATVIGTPAYMSPEQTRAEQIDARADLYAMGILLFEMLTGEKPFRGEDAYEVIRKQREEPPPRVTSLAPLVSHELEQAVFKALEKERDRRYQTATEFLAALDAVPEAYSRPSTVTGEPAVVGDDKSGRVSAVPERFSQKHRLPLLGLLGLFAVGTFVYVSTRPREAEDDERAVGAQAEREQGAEPLAPAPALDAAPRAEALLDAALVESEGEDASASPFDEATLATALRELETPPVELALPENAPEVRTISDVHRLIDRKELTQAIQGLATLRIKSPLNPYYAYLMGDLYFERGAFGEGLAKYYEAIRLSEGYRRRANLQANAIRALGKDATYARAHLLLEKYVGEPAEEALEEAAANRRNPVVAERARLLLTRLTR